MKNPKYAPVEENRQREYGTAISDKIRPVVIGTLVLMGFAALGIAVMRDSSTNSVPIEGLALSPRPCSFSECYASHCNSAVAPYTCLFHNGGPHGGCSAIPWLSETCDDQCNLEGCDSLPIPDTVESCKDQECDETWCAGGQVCPQNVPYQCMDGSARFGCSIDDLQWTLRTDGSTCSACCDTTTC